MGSLSTGLALSWSVSVVVGTIVMKMLLGRFCGSSCVAGHQRKNSCLHCISEFRVCLSGGEDSSGRFH